MPHDAQQRDLNTGLTRIARLHELGVRRIKLLPRVLVNIGIERVRKLLVTDKIWVDAELCSYVDSMFKNYTKEWDSRLGQWKEKPLHNEWSNPADAVRYMAMSGADASALGSGKTRKELRRSRSRSNVVDGMAL